MTSEFKKGCALALYLIAALGIIVYTADCSNREERARTQRLRQQYNEDPIVEILNVSDAFTGKYANIPVRLVQVKCKDSVKVVDVRLDLFPQKGEFWHTTINGGEFTLDRKVKD